MEDKYILIYKSSFLKELKCIKSYIIKISKSVIVAENLIAKISVKLQILQEYPNAYQTLCNYKYNNRKYKRIIVENYSIIYYILEKQKRVVIIHIFYNKRKFFNS